jgi:hypothetical protein
MAAMRRLTPRIGQDGQLDYTGDSAQNGINPNYSSSSSDPNYKAKEPGIDKFMGYAIPIGMAAFTLGSGLAANGPGAASSLGTHSAVDLASAPALGSTAAGIAPGVELGAAGASGLPATAAGAGMFKGIDTTELALAALSLFGGKGPQKMQSFRQPGAITDPKEALFHALQEHYRLGQGLMEAPPTKMRTSIRPPAPVSIPACRSRSVEVSEQILRWPIRRSQSMVI